MFTITKFPVLILSTPRTGSTALGSYILNTFNLKYYFCEPDTAYNEVDKHNFFRNFFKSNAFKKKNYVIKFHLSKYKDEPNDVYKYLLESNDVFKIRIKRRNIIKQIASFYISLDQDKWSYKEDDDLSKEYKIAINKRKIKDVSEHVLKEIKGITETDIKIDLDLYYEDLPVMTGIPFYKTPQPSNYQELCLEIQSIFLRQL